MKKEGLFNYSQLLSQVKERVALAQQRAIYAANEEMLHMYWDIGEMLEKSQMADGWGKKTLERLSVNLKNDYPKVKGFSVRNLYCMMQFYEEYNKELTLPKTSHSSIVQSPTAKLDSYTNNGNYSIVQSPIAKMDKYAKTEKYTITKSAISQLPTYDFELPIKHLPWTHNVILIQKVKDIHARYWYMIQCIKSHWKVEYLKEVIDHDYYGKHGALANNFDATLPAPEAKEVKSMLKDPYIFDMLTFTEQYDERDIEIGLVEHVQKFLVEMGAGFGFMGRQYHIEVSGDDYYLDLLMYNAFMHRYLVIELKNTEFKPEYIGKLNFYCSAIDDILCRNGDNKTIGLLLCKTKDRIKAEYALRDIIKPIGVSDYELGQSLPADLCSSLPSIDDIEKDLMR